ncbi:MAG: hypothetical protein K8L99_29240 [Anaerolineae bacterium]|nr:hypothetical protein [Anaerolineae bacterium]
MTETLDRIIYGKGQPADGSFQVLALTGDLTEAEATTWSTVAALEPVESASPEESLAIGVFPRSPRGFILARAQNQGDEAKPVYEYVDLPRRVLNQLEGNLKPLLTLLEQPLPETDGSRLIEALNLTDVAAWTAEERQASLEKLVNEYAQGDSKKVLALLDAALDERLLLVDDFEGDYQARTAWIQGLMALLPPPARADLTFATHVTLPYPLPVRVIFTPETKPSGRWTTSEDLPTGLTSPYVRLLDEIWQSDSESLLHRLREAEPLAEAILPGMELNEGLNKYTEQVQLYHRVYKGEEVPDEQLKMILNDDLVLPPELHQRYSERLLLHALDERDTEAALIVAQQMDHDPELDQQLNSILVEALEDRPDAVYVFIRTRLNDAMETSPVWVERLQIAALHSLRVAITAGDGATIINWLRLIAREPVHYGLGEILRQGIYAAQTRAHEDGELARQLLVLAVKRDPGALDTLLADKQLLATVPDNLGRALREYSGDAMFTLNNRGPELFLVVMARAASAQSPTLFTIETIDHIWKLYIAGQTFNLPEHFQPEAIVNAWTDTGADWLPVETVEHIATLMLADGRDELFHKMAAQLGERLPHMLATILQNSQRNVTDLIAVLNQLINSGTITPQTAVEIDTALLEIREWRQNAMPLVEQIARLVQQNPTLDIPAETVWKLLDMASTSRSDAVARVASRQLFNDMEARFQEEDNEPEALNFIPDTLLRLFEQLQWSSATRQSVLNWWRDLVRSQPLGRLGRLEKSMDGKRLLEDPRDILQSTLAFRRMLGKRSLEEFARDINTAFSVLEDLSDSFDPSPRRPVKFDVETIRGELNAQKDAMTDQEWRILATNFRELAQLIGEMGDHRSKANLMRRGENIDRQLMAGEQHPDSAVDAMKWIAGYLDGVQDRDENESD